MTNLGFWKNLKRPIFCLAPMADVTDAAFRQIVAKYSKEHFLEKFLDSSSSPNTDVFPLKNSYVTYTEFVSADGLILAPDLPNGGRKKLLKDLEYSEIEKPIVAQLFTSRPEMMEKAAVLVAELGFDGIDINMGCPDKNVERQGAGAALIKNPKLARELIRAAKRGVQNRLPVSVKTRLGYSQDELEIWLPELLAEEPAAIIVHARTRKDMSKVPARWERIKKAVEIRDRMQKITSPPPPLLLKERGEEKNNVVSDFIRPLPFTRGGARGEVETLIIGNGDVKDPAHAYELAKETGCDGVMFGRAIFGQPWLFSNSREWYQKRNNPEVAKKVLNILVEHAKLFEEKFSSPKPLTETVGFKSFAIMKKHFKSYLSNVTPASPTGRPCLPVGRSEGNLKMKLMETKNAGEVEQVVNDFLILYNK